MEHKVGSGRDVCKKDKKRNNVLVGIGNGNGNGNVADHICLMRTKNAPRPLYLSLSI